MSWSRSVGAAAMFLALCPLGFSQSNSPDKALDEIKKELAELRKENVDLRQRLSHLETSPSQSTSRDLEKEIMELNARFAADQEGKDKGPTMPKNTPMGLKGSLRERAEWRSQPTGRDDFRWLQRLSIGMDWMISSELKVYAELRDSRRWADGAATEFTAGNGVGTEATDDSSPEFHQAYAWMKDFMGTGWNTKLGRQELAYGAERLIGDNDWNNVGRSFEGIRADGSCGDLSYSLLAMFLSTSAAPSATYNDRRLYGIYANYPLCPDHMSLDLYALLFGDDLTDTAAAGTGNHLQTYGARASGKIEMLDYELEYATQQNSPKDDGSPIDFNDAYMTHASVGFVLDDMDGKPRVGFAYDMGSTQWNGLFADNHARFGQSDMIISQTNLVHTAVMLDLEVMDGWRLGPSFHWNRAFRQAGTNDLGGELDVTLNGKCGDHLDVKIAAGRNFGSQGNSTFGNAAPWSTPTAGDRSIDATFAFVQFTIPF